MTDPKQLVKTIETLGEIRSKYNFWYYRDRPYYEALSEAIRVLNNLVFERLIEREDIQMTLIDKDKLLRNIQKYAGAASDDPNVMIKDILYMVENAEVIEVEKECKSD